MTGDHRSPIRVGTHGRKKSKSRITNLDIIKTIAQKFFAYFFSKKYGAYFLQKSRGLKSSGRFGGGNKLVLFHLVKRRKVCVPAAHANLQ